MASTYDELARLPNPPASRWTHAAFAFGKPARRHDSITRTLVSFFEFQRREHGEPRASLVPTLAKLSVWIVAGVAATAAGLVLLGALTLRIWTGAFG